MLIGHIATGFTAKKIKGAVPLGVLVTAALLPDLISPFFTLGGLESVELAPEMTGVAPLRLAPFGWSHGLLTAFVLAVLIGVIYYGVKRDLKASALLGGLVVGHWILDLISHRPDLPLYPSGTRMLGLGLWNSVAGTLIVEGGIFAASILLYARSTRPKNKTGRYSLWGFVLLLMVIYLGNIFGPPPPSTEAVTYSMFAMWIFIGWSFWIDKSREVIS